MAASPISRATLLEATDAFMNDMAEVSGYGAERNGTMRKVSNYVAARPILTVPDPWFFAGMVALESSKVCDLFPPRDAAIIMRKIYTEVDAIVGRSGRRISRLAFALIGRLGCGALVVHTRVPDEKISDVILVMMGNQKTWPHLLPHRTAHRQVRAALKTGAPSWWADYVFNRHQAEKGISEEEDEIDFLAMAAAPVPPAVVETLAAE